MLEDELNVIIYIFTYPISVLFNITADFIGVFLSVFLGMFVSIIETINAFNIALHAIICIALPPPLAILVLLMFYILAFYYIIKTIKVTWDVLPFV